MRATFSSLPSPKVPKVSVLKPLISKAFRRGVLTSSMYGESKANFVTPICFAYSVAAKRGFVTILVLQPDLIRSDIFSDPMIALAEVHPYPITENSLDCGKSFAEVVICCSMLVKVCGVTSKPLGILVTKNWLFDALKASRNSPSIV